MRHAARAGLDAMDDIFMHVSKQTASVATQRVKTLRTVLAEVADGKWPRVTVKSDGSLSIGK
jgi:hypothetical protein